LEFSPRSSISKAGEVENSLLIADAFIFPKWVLQRLSDNDTTEEVLNSNSCIVLTWLWKQNNRMGKWIWNIWQHDISENTRSKCKPYKYHQWNVISGFSIVIFRDN
jgi:hypothetical protein